MQLLDSDLIIDSSANLESPLVFSLAQARWHSGSVCEWCAGWYVRRTVHHWMGGDAAVDEGR